MIHVITICDACGYQDLSVANSAHGWNPIPWTFSRIVVMGQEFHYCPDCSETASRVIHEFNARQKAKATK